MNISICFIFKLRRKKPTVSVSKFLCFFLHSNAFLGSRGKDNFSSKHPHHFPPLNGKAIRHSNYKRIPFLGADHSEPYSSISAGCLYHCLALPYLASPLSRLNNVECEAIFYRTSRIEGLRFDINRLAFGPEIIYRTAGVFPTVSKMLSNKRPWPLVTRIFLSIVTSCLLNEENAFIQFDVSHT